MIGFDRAGISDFLGVPEDKVPVMLVAVGRAAATNPSDPRRDGEEVLHRKQY